MLFPLFKYRDRLGRGVAKGEDLRPTLKNFLKFYFRKFSHLLSLNLLMAFQVLPIIIGVVAYFLTDKTPSVTSAAYAPAYGIAMIRDSAGLANILGIEGIQLNIPTFLPVSYWIIGICILFYALTIGWQSCGSAYVLRGLVRGDPVFVYSDYMHAVRRNVKQGFFFGLLDTLITSLLAVDFIYYYSAEGTGVSTLMLGISGALILIYAFMRPYIYFMLITFDMKLFKMFKNALIFTILGVKRNLLALIGIAIVCGLHVLLFVQLLPSAVLLFVYLIATVGFIIAYAVFPVIDRYMIAPYRKESEDGKSQDGEENVSASTES